MNNKYLKIRIDDRVGWLEYNYPPINAFNWGMLREVPAALQALLDEPQVRVVVFASAIDKYFSVGADLKVFDGIGTKGMAERIFQKESALFWKNANRSGNKLCFTQFILNFQKNHDVPIIYDPAEARFIELAGNGMSLGLQNAVVYKEHLYTDVRPGQVYMALTDGLFEAFNKKGEMFGKDRIRNLIRDFAYLSASEITDRINIELSLFLGDTSPDDDLTFVIVKVL